MNYIDTVGGNDMSFKHSSLIIQDSYDSTSEECTSMEYFIKVFCRKFYTGGSSGFRISD